MGCFGYPSKGPENGGRPPRRQSCGEVLILRSIACFGDFPFMASIWIK